MNTPVDCHKEHEVEKITSKDTGKEYWVCHTCHKTLGRVCEVYSRIVGYLRPVSSWNVGKKSEFESRKTYEV
jgi:anaerobic ribonucleoside-triphosphate reductase